MYKLLILAVGKLKEDHWREAQREFLLRLAPFSKMEVVEVNAEPITDTSDRAASIKAEGARLAARLPKDAFVVALDRLKIYPRESCIRCRNV